MKSKEKVLQYYVIYERDEDGGYVASSPAIPGCVVYGRTLKEAYNNIRSAITECIEVIREFRKELPKETIKPKMAQELSFVEIYQYAKT